MAKGKLEKEIVEPYMPNKIVPPEYIRDILNQANKDFPAIEFEFEIPHKWTLEEYKNQYEELERQMIQVLSWRSLWFGRLEAEKK